MADWNAYRRQAMIAGLKEARLIAVALHDKARGYQEDAHQRRMALRIVEAINGRILDIEAEGQREVYTHFMEEPKDEV